MLITNAVRVSMSITSISTLPGKRMSVSFNLLELGTKEAMMREEWKSLKNTKIHKITHSKNYCTWRMSQLKRKMIKIIKRIQSLTPLNHHREKS